MPWRAKIAWAITVAAMIAWLMSLLTLPSISIFIGIGAVPLFLLGAWLSPSLKRRALAVGGACWRGVCLIVLVVASIA